MTKKHLASLLLALALPALFTSCIKDDEETSQATDYCYISSFQLGSFQRTLFTKSISGKDSAYTTTFAGSLFPMTINQQTQVIENLDSLPLRTRLSRALATVSGVGTMVWRKADLTGQADTTWKAYGSKDSIDFSTPLHFAVVSGDGKSLRTYTVKVNAHQQKGDTTVWHRMATATLLASWGERKALAWNDLLIVLGSQTDGTLGYVQHPLASSGTWVEATTSGTAGADVSTLQRQGTRLYLSTADGVVLQSTNGVDWTPAAHPTQSGLRLVGASDSRLYALLGGKLVSSAGGAWTEETLDADAANLPVGSIHTCAYETSGGMQRLLMVGTSSDAGEADALVWAKSWTEGQEAQENWMFYPRNGADAHRLPALAELNVQRYDNGFIALGGAAGSRYAAMDFVRYSPDHGITWKTYENDDMLVDPAMRTTAQAATHITTAVDGEQFLWVLIDNEVWRGRINRLGFLRQDPE